MRIHASGRVSKHQIASGARYWQDGTVTAYPDAKTAALEFLDVRVIRRCTSQASARLVRMADELNGAQPVRSVETD